MSSILSNNRSDIPLKVPPISYNPDYVKLGHKTIQVMPPENSEILVTYFLADHGFAVNASYTPDAAAKEIFAAHHVQSICLKKDDQTSPIYTNNFCAGRICRIMESREMYPAISPTLLGIMRQNKEQASSRND